jgi:hypothetical protein
MMEFANQFTNQSSLEKGHMLPVDVVESDYFLERIHALEQKYGMEWGVFLAKYATGQYREDACQNPEFAEWAFLCNNFMSELIDYDHGGPPGCVANPDTEKPEATSGFFILVCRACLTARRCKSSSQRDGREVIAKRKGEITLAARRGLKEARSKDASR